MTKREYLESIGYKRETRCDKEMSQLLYKIYKCYDGVEYMSMYILWADNKYFVELTNVGTIENQRQIDDLQIAFNNVRRDFEEMQKYD